jgi:hypothetical protein
MNKIIFIVIVIVGISCLFFLIPSPTLKEVEIVTIAPNIPDTVYYTTFIEAQPIQGGEIRLINESWTTKTQIEAPAQEKIIIEARTKDDYIFSGWYQGSVFLTNNNLLEVNPSNTSYQARFTKIGKVLISASASKGGEIKINSNNWSSSQSVSLNPEQRITLEARAKDNFEFQGWYDGLSLISNQKIITVNQSVNYEARFIQTEKLPVSVFSGEGGEIKINNNNWSNNQRVYLNQGEIATLEARPKEGFEFQGWYNNSIKISTQKNITVDFSGNYQAVFLQKSGFFFSGYQWEVRSWNGAPGPNHWSQDNVWIEDGNLHLKISRDSNGIWRCAELHTINSFGDGTYEFKIAGPIDQLDKNVVLGLFQYPRNKTDGTHEIDIEISRWGWNNPHNLIYVVYDSNTPFQKQKKEFNFSVTNDYTIHRFTRRGSQVEFSSGEHSWIVNNASTIDMPVHINLWLYETKPPVNEIEVVISEFNYYPL